jgi:hypothetical protein
MIHFSRAHVNKIGLFRKTRKKLAAPELRTGRPKSGLIYASGALVGQNTGFKHVSKFSQSLVLNLANALFCYADHLPDLLQRLRAVA